MWKKTEIYREQFSGGDEASVTFSVDPEMHNKLGIKKVKRGEENTHDLQKIYEFQLRKDLEKIVARKGPYVKRAALFEQIRSSDPEYVAIAEAPKAGADANFNELVDRTKDHSWQSTSKPYGEIAHKRYLEYLANLPKGPTWDEIQDRKQRAQDRELWDQIVSGKLEPTKRELLRKKRQQEREKQVEEDGDFDIDGNVVLSKELMRKKAFVENDFAGMRRLPTEREHLKSMRQWHRGIYYPYNIDKGFPFIIRAMEGVSVADEKRIAPDNLFPPPRPVTSDRFMKDNVGQEKKYADYLATENFAKAEAYLHETRRREEKQRLRNQRRQAEEQRMQRRRGQAGVAIATSVIDAKWQQTKDKYNVTLRVNDPNDHTSPDNHEDDSDSDSDSGSDDSGNSSEEEDEEEEKEDSDEDTVLRNKRKRLRAEAKEQRAQRRALRRQREALDQQYQKRPTQHPIVRAVQRVWQQLPKPFPGGRRGNAGARYQIEGGEKAEDDTDGARDKEQEAPGEHRDIAHKRRAGGWLTYSRLKRATHHLAKRLSFRRKHTHGSHHNGSMHVNTTGQHSDPNHPEASANNDDFVTLTMRQKQEASRSLQRLHSDVHSAEVKASLLALTPDEPTTEELVKFLKRKRRELREEILAVEMKDDDEKHPARDKERIRQLQLRLRNLDELEEERFQRERHVANLLASADEIVAGRAQQIAEMENGPVERWIKSSVDRLSRVRRGIVAILWSAVHRPRPVVPRLLPVVSRDNYAAEVQRLMKSRCAERRRELLLRKRLGWLLGHDHSHLRKRKKRGDSDDDHRNYLDELIIACNTGNYREVLDLLDPHRLRLDDLQQDPLVNVNAVNHDQLTPLYATLQMVLRKQVLDEAIDVDDWQLSWLQRMQRRARHLLVRASDYYQPRFDLVISALLHFGADLNYPRAEGYGLDGETLLHVAAKTGALDVLEWLLQQGVDCNQLTSIQRKLPLMCAVEHNQLEAAMILLRYGAVIAVHHQDAQGNSVMHYAAKYASVVLTQALLICGAPIHQRNAQLKLPAEEAQALNRIEIMTTIQSYRDGREEHQVRMQYLMDNTNGARRDYEPLLTEEPTHAALSVDTMWRSSDGGHVLQSESDKRVQRIWRPYLKGNQIKPIASSDSAMNSNSERLGSNKSSSVKSSSDVVMTAPRIRRTVLQLSFAQQKKK